jgi:predicted Zn-dependent protease
MAATLLAAAAVGCGGVHLVAQPEETPDYLRYVAFDGLDRVPMLLRWHDREFPLRVHLPRPPERLWPDADGAWDAARRGILAWNDAVRPGLPSFVFVDEPCKAKIPVGWTDQSPSSSVAHCFYDIDLRQRRFGVMGIVINHRYEDGTVPALEDLERTVLHEMGHALGLGGHSPNPEDAMYGWVKGPEADSALAAEIRPNAFTGLSERDRATLRALYAKPVGATMAGSKRAY